MSRSSSRTKQRTKSQAHPRPSVAAEPETRAPWQRRNPWLAVGITLLALITAPFSVEAVRDAVTLGSVGEGRLEASPAYLSITPISNVLDTLTLLTVGQHIAVILWAIAVFAACRVVLARNAPTTLIREVRAAALFLTALIVTYVAVAYLPRPMAQLVVSDETVLAVDFHSHTKYSHDGRSGWTDDDVRNWHRAAGFDAAYITDHASYEGAERGIASNPGLAGQGMMLLQGLEVFYRGEHVNALGAGRRYRGVTTPDLKDIDEQSLALAGLIPAMSPVLIETIPGNLSKVPGPGPTGAPGVVAIEVVDGSPRGLSQGRRDRQRIVHIADSLNLALVTGSDNHGYGRAAPGWTLLRIPGWRGMATDSLSRRIEEILRTGRRDAARPVERRVAGASNPAELAFAGPAVVWRMFTTVGPDERVMWLVWTWGLAFLSRVIRRSRRRETPASAA